MDEFHIEIKYVEESPLIDSDSYDLIYIFWWGERYHRKYTTERAIVVKEISSHRWAFEEKFGKHTPKDALDRYMCDADYLVATSQRLAEIFGNHYQHVMHYPLGVDTERFKPTMVRAGDLKIGWAGNASDPIKRVNEILLPACGNEFILYIADGQLAYDLMPEFFNKIDVICIASDEEGTPLPLIEAMACGCFPVVTDVGVASELIIHGKNGLIVNATVESFRGAFEWCRNNIENVRLAGLGNSALIQSKRTWSISAKKFAAILRDILSTRKTAAVNSEKLNNEVQYANHFQRVNQGGASDDAYKLCCDYYHEDVEELLPVDLNARILEVGTGYGYFLRFLSDIGYVRVVGVDISAELLKQAKLYIGDRIERLELADAKDFLPRFSNTFDCIVMLDMIEHVPYDQALDILNSARNALRPGGRLILRTPNMANLLGCYSLYMDPTHYHAYTEWSLAHALEQVGFELVNVHVPTRFSSRKRRLRAWVNRIIHLVLYRINDRAMPRWFGKNIVIIGIR